MSVIMVMTLKSESLQHSLSLLHGTGMLGILNISGHNLPLLRIFFPAWLDEARRSMLNIPPTIITNSGVRMIPCCQVMVPVPAYFASHGYWLAWGEERHKTPPEEQKWHKISGKDLPCIYGGTKWKWPLAAADHPAAQPYMQATLVHTNTLDNYSVRIPTVPLN